jgi:hypothetical protein
MSNPFDYVKEILQGKKNLIKDAETEKDYVPYLVNRSLSYYYDCVMWSNEMNIRPSTDKKMQFDFLLNTVRSTKRPFAKWIKRESSEDIECLKILYGYSNQKALEALRLLSDEQIQELKEKTRKGGLRK